MDYIFVLKSIWNKSKLSFFLSLFSVSLLFLNGFVVRPFRLVPAVIRRKFHNMASSSYSPDSAQMVDFKFAARQAINIFAINDQGVLQNSFPGYDAYHVGEARHVRYTLIIDKQNKSYHVAIRGSENDYNWIDNFTAEFVRDDELNATLHKGYREIALNILNDLESLLADKQYTITVSGGSLGGVISIAVGWYLDSRGYNIKQIYNFAGPKLTDDDYSHLRVLTVINKLDAVWMLPLATLLHRYRHQGERVVIIPSMDYNDSKGAADWRLYKDSLLSDFLLSSWGIDRKLDTSEHLTYGAYFLRFLEEKAGERA